MRALPGLRLEIQNASGAGDTRPLSPTQKKKENNVKSSSGAAASKWLENERKRKRLALSLERFFFLSSFLLHAACLPSQRKASLHHELECVVTLVPGFCVARKRETRELSQVEKKNRKRNVEGRRSVRATTTSPLRVSTFFPL